MSPQSQMYQAYRILLAEQKHKDFCKIGFANESMEFGANNRRYNDRNSTRNYQNTTTDREQFSREGEGSLRRSLTGKKGPNLCCDHCRRTGHTTDKCYKIHGYTSSHKGSNKRYDNIAHLEEEEDVVVIKAMSAAFTFSQNKQILALPDNEKGGVVNTHLSNKEEKLDSTSILAGTLCLLSTRLVGWIIDIGAIDHMCYDLSMFSSFKILVDNFHNITIPDERKVKVKY